ncbi:hypothetical protein [Planotetraspora phitsanulokensis]|nr:hypothetical protein [Planotetraspora phitsanulokensis]
MRRIARGFALILLGWTGPGALLLISGSRIPNSYWYGFMVLDGLMAVIILVEMYVRFRQQR